MKLCFDEIPETRLESFYGGEKHLAANMYVDEHGKILRGRLEAGASIGLHTHDTSAEIIYFLSGSGKVITDGKTETVKAGDCHYCPKGSAHTMINDSADDLTFFAVVTAR